jgi:hypothetical protein
LNADKVHVFLSRSYRTSSLGRYADQAAFLYRKFVSINMEKTATAQNDVQLFILFVCMYECNAFPGWKTVQRDFATGQPQFVAYEMFSVKSPEISLKQSFKRSNLIDTVVVAM